MPYKIVEVIGLIKKKNNKTKKSKSKSKNRFIVVDSKTMKIYYKCKTKVDANNKIKLLQKIKKNN
jgi:hypothetical protein